MSQLEYGVQKALRRAGHVFTDLVDWQRLTGGAVQETWRITAKVAQKTETLILRRAPDAAYDLNTISLPAQADLMALASQQGVPGPDILAVLQEEDGLGAGFLMTYVAGETIPKKILHNAQFASVRPLLARQCGQILAHIHSIPLDALPVVPRSSAAARLTTLRAQYDRLHHPRPVFELGFQWLRQNLPDDVPRPTLVHGDFRNGNLIIDQNGIAAVLDWERAFVGDPMHDLALICVGSWRFGEIDKPVGGFGRIVDLVAGYESVAGPTVDLKRVRFWEVFGSLEWGVTTIGFAQTAPAGSAGLEHKVIGRRASETEIDLLNLIETNGGSIG